MTLTAYYDARWGGPLATIAAALTAYGWTVAADGSATLTDPSKNTLGILGLAGGRVVTLDGTAYAAVRSTASIPTPAGLTDPGVQHSAAYVGIWATSAP